jgi:PAS domain-containing protein
VSQPTADRLPQAWLAAAMGRLPDGVAVFDGDWTFRYANPAAARLPGARTAELAGRNLWIALPAVAGNDAAMLDALLTGEPVQVTTIQEERVAPSLPTDEVWAAWRRLDTTSCTIVPLRDRGRPSAWWRWWTPVRGRRTARWRSPPPSRPPAAAPWR